MTHNASPAALGRSDDQSLCRLTHTRGDGCRCRCAFVERRIPVPITRRRRPEYGAVRQEMARLLDVALKRARPYQRSKYAKSNVLVSQIGYNA